VSISFDAPAVVDTILVGVCCEEGVEGKRTEKALKIYRGSFVASKVLDFV